MAKGILEFNLPEEQNEFAVACKAVDFAICWDSLKEEIRQILKYGTLTAEQVEILEKIQNSMTDYAGQFELPELQ